MAVVLYKGDDEIRVEPKRLKSHISQGWSLKKGGAAVLPERAQAPDDTEMLKRMNILPSVDNVIIGATNIPV